ncbi:MAG: primosomal protein N' [Bacteroides sp.]|nr:primosomal protein N' [Ruminococcus flavefaciens]MCM1553925.1 primosomal protein N' [Bacteroides sp.]
MGTFADVLLPLPVRLDFTYAVPESMQGQLQVGMRVCVPFGKSKVYAGLVKKIHQDSPSQHQIKSIIAVLDEEPVVNERQFAFWKWMADYYLCTEGDVMAAALPSGFKLNNETKLVMNPDFDGDVSNLNQRQLDIVSALQVKGELTIEEAAQASAQAKVFPLVRGLREQGVILVKEEISERYRPLRESFVRWGNGYRNNIDKQHELFDRLEKRAFSQLQIVMAYVSMFQQAQDGWVRKALLLGKAQQSGATLQALVKKGVFEVSEQQKSRLQEYAGSDTQNQNVQLSQAQQDTLRQIKEGLEQKAVCLLHGVTSSGKTEIYIQLIRETLAQGKQALFLLPEIALSAQMILRLRKYFGQAVGVYHSRYNEAEKVEIWKNTGSRYQIILGARSALFLPFTNLGLIVVDEEHETSYKQQDPAPRYHARDAAVFLAHLHGAKTVLGSATPSLESYYNALHGKYALATLFTRYGGVRLPDILVSDLKEEKRQKNMLGNFSSLLAEKIQEALENDRQVILFQNRRGFSTRLECEVCGHVPACEKCDVTLTFHKRSGVLLCHYCGHTVTQPQVCPQCGSPALRMKGFGTERIEEDLQLLFPQAKVERMDLDSTRAKGSYHKIIDDFQNRKIDILVGTQMVTKGLDFDNVAVVGIIDADSLISFPDFRSYERSFHLMTQVSGRAGRKEGGGEVVIQTHKPDLQVIQDVMNSDYTSMYTHQIQERMVFRYPPFYRLIRLSIRHKDENMAAEGARFLAAELRKIFGERVLGPEYPMVSRINTYYIQEIMLKIERTPRIEQMKARLRQCIDLFLNQPRFGRIRIVVDVDPQ